MSPQAADRPDIVGLHTEIAHLRHQLAQLQHRRDDPAALGSIRRRQLPPAVQAAWWAALSRFVAEITESYPHLWPKPPADDKDPHSRTRKRPFPPCWRQHDGLVDDLVAMQQWQLGLLDGAEWTAPGPRGWMEWRSFLDAVAVHVQMVSQHCSIRHVGTTLPVDPPAAPPQTVPQPPHL